LGGGATDAPVAVGVVAGDRRELVAVKLVAAGVVRGGVLGGGAAGQRPEFEQGGGGSGAVEVAVVDDRAVVGAVGAAVVGVQILDQVDAERSERERPARCCAVAVAGVDEHVTDLDAGGVHALEHGHERGRWVVVAAGQAHAAGEFWELGAVFVFDDRGGL
jgi:hypothetical protein